jgi:hypothetical protein
LEDAEKLKKAVETSPTPTSAGLLVNQQDDARIAIVLSAQPHLTKGNYYASVALRLPGTLSAEARGSYLQAVDETLEALSPEKFSWATQKSVSRGRWVEGTTKEKGKPVVYIYFGKSVGPGETRAIPLIIDIPHTPAAIKWFEMEPREFRQWLEGDEGKIVQEVWSTFLDRLEDAFHFLLRKKLDPHWTKPIDSRYHITRRYSPEGVLKTGKVMSLEDALEGQVRAGRGLAPLGTVYKKVPGGIEATTRLWHPKGDAHTLWKIWDEAIGLVRKQAKTPEELGMIDDIFSTYFAPEASKRVERMTGIDREVGC